MHHHANFQDSSAVSSAAVEAFAARNLQFLNLIENTLDGLSSSTGHVRVIIEAFEKVLGKLHEEPPEQQMDAEGRLCTLLEKASDSTKRIYADVSGAHESACKDHMLRADDGVVEAFADYLENLKVLHDVIEEFREWIDTHDALLEHSGSGVFNTSDDLIAALEA